MPKDVQKGLKDLSISPNRKVKDKKSRKHVDQEHRVAFKSDYLYRTSPNLRKQYWVYGYHLKYRYVRRLSEKFDLPYQTDPLTALFTIQTYLIRTCGLLYQWHAITHCGKNAIVLAFVEDDGRKRLELNRLTEQQMDRVRIALLLPEGTKPKWYDVNDNYDDYAELSSEDEDLPPIDSSESECEEDEGNPSNVKGDKDDASDKPSDESVADEVGEDDEDYDADPCDDFLGWFFKSDSEDNDAEEEDECQASLEVGVKAAD